MAGGRGGDSAAGRLQPQGLGGLVRGAPGLHRRELLANALSRRAAPFTRRPPTVRGVLK